MRRTKIICTLGASTVGRCRDMIINGVDAARVNFSHETHDIHASRIKELKEAREALKIPVPLIADTKGPEIRTGLIKENTELRSGQEITILSTSITGDASKISLSYPDIYKKIGTGNDIFIDDGKLHLQVKRIEEENIVCDVISGGRLSSRKGVNIPGCACFLPFLSSKDMEDIDFAIVNEFDYIALSFVRTADDIRQVREILNKRDCSDIKIIAKIENREAVENIDEIIESSDGIMIGRGDLGVEMPLSQVPIVQKKLVRKCYTNGKPVITATQMLESMIENIIPTRAEVSDVANAIYDGSSAVMLSGETACGKYPVETLKRMVDVIDTIENDIDYRKRFFNEDWLTDKSIVSIIGRSTTVAAFELDASAIVVITNSGNSARMISRFRPSCPIIAVTVEPRIERQLNLSWGIRPVRTGYIKDMAKLYDNIMKCAEETGIVGKGDLVVMTAGMPTGPKGKTNIMKIHRIGDAVY